MAGLIVGCDMAASKYMYMRECDVGRSVIRPELIRGREKVVHLCSEHQRDETESCADTIACHASSCRGVVKDKNIGGVVQQAAVQAIVGAPQ